MINHEMLNPQSSMLNKWGNDQCDKSLNHYFIEYSLTLEHCQLIIIVPEAQL